jgi:hypothetical protein
MEKVNQTVQLYAQMITFLVVWVAVIVAAGIFSTVDLWAVVKSVPTAISIYAVIALVFTQWVWRWKIFQGWLIKIPDLQGTWRGKLKSDWIDPATQQAIAPIPVVLVIRQTFSTISCALMTKESSSYSTTAAINLAPDNKDLYLTYNYTNRPKATIRDRSAIHDGASILKIIKRPTRMLEGEYWTSRKTRGEIILNFESKSLVERF